MCPDKTFEFGKKKVLFHQYFFFRVYAFWAYVGTDFILMLRFLPQVLLILKASRSRVIRIGLQNLWARGISVSSLND